MNFKTTIIAVAVALAVSPAACPPKIGRAHV